MKRVINIIIWIVQFINIIIRVVPYLGKLYDSILACYVVIRTETEYLKGNPSLMTSTDKQKYAKKLLKKFSAFKNKPDKVLSRIINSACVFVEHKEK
jgi:hypothetical protein